MTKTEYLARLATKKGDFASGNWRHTTGLSTRTYESYAQYVAHQKSKLHEIGGEAFVDPRKAVEMFRKRFSGLSRLRENATILCLGARRGEEVQALREMGHFALGIDLEPGKDNAYVLTGDFHDIRFGDTTVDAVYINCLDHALDINKIVKEVRRILKPGGVFIVDIVYGFEEGFLVGDHDCMHWPTARAFAALLAGTGGFDLAEFRDLTDLGSAQWTQAQLIKPSESAGDSRLPSSTVANLSTANERP
jgi:SAM-dependent methyltransferase